MKKIALDCILMNLTKIFCSLPCIRSCESSKGKHLCKTDICMAFFFTPLYISRRFWPEGVVCVGMTNLKFNC